MTDQMIHLSFSMKEIFNLIPKMAENVIRYNPLAAKIADSFNGREVGIAFDFDSETYSLMIKNGKDFTAGNGNLEKPMVKIAMTMKDLENLIKVKNANVFLNRTIDPSKFGDAGTPVQMYEKLAGIKGTVVTELKDADNEVSRITFVFNQSDMPKATVRMTMDTFSGMVSKKDNPVNLFMTGMIQVEGDMGIAMNLQTLF